MVYYGREYKEENKRQKRTRGKTETPTMTVGSALETAWGKMPRGTQVKRDGLALTVERRSISSRIAFRNLSRPQLQVRSEGVGPRGQTLKIIRTEDVQGSPHKLPS